MRAIKERDQTAGRREQGIDGKNRKRDEQSSYLSKSSLVEDLPYSTPEERGGREKRNGHGLHGGARRGPFPPTPVW